MTVFVWMRKERKADFSDFHALLLFSPHICEAFNLTFEYNDESFVILLPACAA